MNLIDQLRHKLIVSCQAEEGFPLNQPDRLAAMAVTVVRGGADAIRASEPENIRAMKQAVDVPIIGIYKKDYPGFAVRITPTIDEVAAIVEAGSDMIALDATDRPRPGDLSLPELFAAIRERYDVPIMADIATLEEGITAAKLGADVVATTLSGYTASSDQQPGPDIALIQALTAAVDVPVIAEGRIAAPDHVRAAFEAGAYAVVVGSIITRPHLITEPYVAAARAFADRQMLADRQPVVALDIGGTKIAGGVFAADGQLLFDEKIYTATHEGSAAVAEQVIDLVAGLIENCEISPAAIGVSTGGQVDRHGYIIGSTDVIPGWIGVPIKDRLHEHFGLPVHVINDGHASALAEARLGAGRGYDPVFCVTLGTGLGGGLIVNGQIQTGAAGLAGSIGRLRATCDGETYMLIEEIVSGPGLIRLYNARVPAEQAVDNGQIIAERAQAGEAAAIEAVQELGEWLGLGLANALYMVDAACVVLGGSVAQIGTPLIDAARQGLAAHGYANAAELPILPAKFGPKAGLVGAAAYAQAQQ
ncbi:putative N-acetylmannosamine-6-phosphate 2-epimerase [Chloroflexota bacterium]